MKIFKFSKEVGNTITQYSSNFIMSRILKTEGPASIGCMHLEANGLIGFHEATCPQLLLIVSGEGEVRGESDEKMVIKAGEAVFWEKGEGHETTSEKGLMAIVIESDHLNPSLFMPEKD